jgi:hypothetical protein
MIVIPALTAVFLAGYLACGWIYDHTRIGQHVDRILSDDTPLHPTTHKAAPARLEIARRPSHRRGTSHEHR